MPKSVVALCLFFLLVAGFSCRAEALPIFAHRYGFTCQQCHTTVPQLNEFGEAFRRRGFRLGSERPTVPLAVKVQTAYSSNGNGDAQAPLPKAIVDEIELLSAGPIGRHASYFVEQYVLDGGVAGRPRDVWVQLDRTKDGEPGEAGMHVMLGQFTLPLPVDPETERPTLAHYGVFDQTVGANAFTFFDPHLGADVFYSDERRGLEAHLAAVQAYDRGSRVPSAGVDVMGSLSARIAERTDATFYGYDGRRANGPVLDRFHRYGYSLTQTVGQFDATALVQTGVDSSSDGFGLPARSSGGFAQLGWHPSSGFNVYARYDSTFDDFNGRTNGATLSVVMRPRRNMRLTIEGSRGADRTNQLGVGLLFAY